MRRSFIIAATAVFQLVVSAAFAREGSASRGEGVCPHDLRTMPWRRFSGRKPDARGTHVSNARWPLSHR